MEWHGKGLNQGPLEHGKEICSSFKSNEVIIIKSSRKSRNNSEKFSKKESSEIQGVTCWWWARMRLGRSGHDEFEDGGGGRGGEDDGDLQHPVTERSHSSASAR